MWRACKLVHKYLNHIWVFRHLIFKMRNSKIDFRYFSLCGIVQYYSGRRARRDISVHIFFPGFLLKSSTSHNKMINCHWVTATDAPIGAARWRIWTRGGYYDDESVSVSEVIKIDGTLVHLTIRFRSSILAHKPEKVKRLTVTSSFTHNMV